MRGISIPLRLENACYSDYNIEQARSRSDTVEDEDKAHFFLGTTRDHREKDAGNLKVMSLACESDAARVSGIGLRAVFGRILGGASVQVVVPIPGEPESAVASNPLQAKKFHVLHHLGPKDGGERVAHMPAHAIACEAPRVNWSFIHS